MLGNRLRAVDPVLFWYRYRVVDVARTLLPVSSNCQDWPGQHIYPSALTSRIIRAALNKSISQDNCQESLSVFMKPDKKKQQKIKERYLRDVAPVRLGNLASNLARIKSFSDQAVLNQATVKVVDESKFFIEWTAADAELSLQVELLELQRLLARWRLAWDEIWNDLEKRNDMATQAGLWSQRILERSGLLNPPQNQT